MKQILETTDGFQWEIISHERAKELFYNEIDEVYILYIEDEAEGLVQDVEDIEDGDNTFALEIGFARPMTKRWIVDQIKNHRTHVNSVNCRILEFASDTVESMLEAEGIELWMKDPEVPEGNEFIHTKEGEKAWSEKYDKFEEEFVDTACSIIEALPDPPEEKMYVLFGEDVCRELTNEGIESAIEVCKTEAYALRCYDDSTTIAEILSDQSGWNDYAFITKEEYDQIAAI